MRTGTGLTIGVAATAMMMAGGVRAQAGPAPSPTIAVRADAAPDGSAPTLSVMTYNIEGLPWPVRSGRGAAAGRIARQLAAMRATGTQPHVVVLQEAFGAAQKAIGAQAGYRYIAFGPGRHAVNIEAMDADDRAFAADARLLKGERAGKWKGSGLAILSDYPILSVARDPFPAFACAGLDCLANKGVMMATIAVPGVTQPVAVIATHMNSKEASAVPPPRFAWAFQRQVRTIGTFLRGHLSPDTPYVFAGDTNIGRSASRAAAFEAMLATLPRADDGGVVRTALTTCLAADRPCALDQPREVRRAYLHGKDWQVYAPGATTGIAPLAISTPFGHDARGRMLSDHIGYTADYRLVRTPVDGGGGL